MTTFYIQTDKDYYFAGDTVNGSILVNVGSLIVGAQGLSLKFTGYECVKWLEARELHRPHPAPPGHPQPLDPIAAIPPHLIFNSDNLTISSCESQDNREQDRPRYYRTSNNRYFEMRYYQTRNMFTRQKTMIFNCSGFPPGQYSFPFSFKTFEGWPANFIHYTPQKKGIIKYHMTAAIEPSTNQFQIQGSREIILRETRMVQSQQQKSSGEIISCCCMSKGFTTLTLSFAKDGYTPGQLVQMIIEIDNTACMANINTISITVENQITLRSKDNPTSDLRTFLKKQINGVYAGKCLVGDKAIYEQFIMPNKPQIKPTCSGKLLFSQYNLSIKLNHDISCGCCSNMISAGIPLIIFPIVPAYNMPFIFKDKWAPKMMPPTVLNLPDNFKNINLSAMLPPPPLPIIAQQPPPPPPPPPPPQINSNPNMGMGMNVNMNTKNNMDSPNMNNNMGINAKMNNSMGPNNNTNFGKNPNMGMSMNNSDNGMGMGNNNMRGY